MHLFKGLEVAVMLHICKAVLEKSDLETCLMQVFACVSYTIFCCNAAYIYVCCIQKFQDFAQGLSCTVHSFESRVLFDSLVASLVEDQFLLSVRHQVCMDLTSMGSGDAV